MFYLIGNHKSVKPLPHSAALCNEIQLGVETACPFKDGLTSGWGQEATFNYDSFKYDATVRGHFV
jgi:hypothetical protein